jgi:transcriptional regulator with XRE-family HTH domain
MQQPDVRPRPHPIREVMWRKGVTQHSLATLTGFSQPYISLANNGRIWPSAEYRRACAVALGCDETTLFDDAGRLFGE